MIYLIPTDTCFWLASPIDDIKLYEKIYKIKKRTLEKPLPIMVKDINWLKKNTTLTPEQIKFIQNYKRPYTILTNSPSISVWLNYETEKWEGFRNRELYKKIAIRVANNTAQKDLIGKIWPIFLTSANYSWEPELYTTKDSREKFSYYIEKKQIKILTADNFKLPPVKSSDIFEFIWDSLEPKYLRKN